MVIARMLQAVCSISKSRVTFKLRESEIRTRKGRASSKEALNAFSRKRFSFYSSCVFVK